MNNDIDFGVSDFSNLFWMSTANNSFNGDCQSRGFDFPLEPFQSPPSQLRENQSVCLPSDCFNGQSAHPAEFHRSNVHSCEDLNQLLSLPEGCRLGHKNSSTWPSA